MGNLLTAAQVRLLCRPISTHYDDTRIEMFIPEAEQLDVKPILGEQMYIDLLEAQTGTTLSVNQVLLLDGGIYTVENRKYIFKGLKVAISYFVYSRLIRNADGQLTRFGFVDKNLNESDRPQLKEKLVAADDAAKSGNAYLNEVLQLIKLNDMDEVYVHPDKSKRTYTINAIGD